MIEVKLDVFISRIIEMYIQYGYSDGKFLVDWLNEYIGAENWSHNRRLNILCFNDETHYIAFKLVFSEYCLEITHD